MYFHRVGRRRNRSHHRGNKGFQAALKNHHFRVGGASDSQKQVSVSSLEPKWLVFLFLRDLLCLKVQSQLSDGTSGDAEKAFELEQLYDTHQSNQFILRFPDPFIDKAMIQGMSPAITDIRVQFPLVPRFVYVSLDPSADVEEVTREIGKIAFGAGFMRLERKMPKTTEASCDPADIDPLTIFLGNIPTSTPVQAVKKLVPLASKIDVGHARKHRYGRYAFVKFRTPEDARMTYKTLKGLRGNLEQDLIVRFKRHRGALAEGKRLVQSTVIDLTLEDAAVKQEPRDEVQEVTETIEPIDWERFRETEFQRYEEKPDLRQLPNFTDYACAWNASQLPGSDVTASDLDEIFAQIDTEFNYSFNSDLDI